jgi:hypothetical protein
MQMDIPTQKKQQHQRDKTPKHNQKTPQQIVEPTTDGVVSDDELVEEEGNVGEEDSDEPDNRTPRETSAQRKSREEEEIWAGIMDEIEEVQHVEGEDMDMNSGSESESETELGEEENEEAEDDGNEADLEAAADDDDYGDLEMDDNMSVASVDSRQFEKEYERDIRQEIQTEGIDAIEWEQPAPEEDGIDWNDATTYHYNAPGWEYDEHGFVIGLEVFRPASEEHLFIADTADISQNLDVLRSQPVFGDEWPMPSDSENEDGQSEKTIDDVERRQSHASDTSGLTSLSMLLYLQCVLPQLTILLSGSRIRN